MSLRTKRFILSLFIAATLLAGAVVKAEEPKAEKTQQAAQKLSKTSGSPLFQVLNINNLSAWFGANGNGAMPPSQNGDGVVFPRLTGSAIYEDGFMWGGLVYRNAAKTIGGNKNQPYRIGGNEYVQGNAEGWVNGFGASAVAADQNDPAVRIYRIRRDWMEMSLSELKQDAAETNEISPSAVTQSQMDAVLAQYKKDWEEWPVSKGAPYIERNGIAGYQAPKPFNYDPNAGPLFTVDSLISGKYDEPGVAGADVNIPASQVIWTAYNDLNRTNTTALYGSEPMGLEAQVTMWGYKRSDALGNLAFKRLRLINKGGVDTSSTTTVAKGSFWIDSMYVAQWSDPDLGNAGDDVIGCDTTLSLGFVYNGFAVDNEYRSFNLPPPSAGYDFLAGAAIATGNPNDTAVYDFKYVLGKKNQGMSSFSYFSAGAALADPRPRSYTVGSNRWWKMLRGFAPQDGPEVPYPFPPGIPPSKFPLSGDPVTGTGFLDGQGQTYSFSPGDRRLIMSTGPFSLAPGDTQEIVVALVVGLGADRISSVAALKFNDRFVQNVFNGLFVLPSGLAPSLQVAELDKKVVLDWGWDADKINKTEGTPQNPTIHNPGGFVFEGYNVYQLPTAGAELSSGKRIATFDVINGYAVLQDQTLDGQTGLVVTKPVQFGTNSGVQHYFVFDRDYLLDRPALYNGQDYYLAVTAYYRSTIPSYTPQVLESPAVRATVRPQQPVPGTQYRAGIGDTISTVTHTGPAEGKVEVTVVDPSKLTGNNYELSFTGAGPTFSYSIKNVTKNTTLYTGGKNLGTDWGGEALSYPIVDGMLVKVIDGAGVSNSATTWSGGTQWVDGTGLFEGDKYAGFSDGIIPGALATDHFGAYAPSWKLQDIYPIEIRWDDSVATPSNRQLAYRIVRHATYTNNTYILGGAFGNSSSDTLRSVEVPFTVWDVSNPGSPRQLAVSFRDGNRNGKWDIGGTEWINIYNKTYDSTMSQFDRTPNIATGGPLADIVYIADFKVKTGTKNGQNAGTLTISPKIRFSTADKYTFSDPTKAAVKNNMALAKVEAEKVNVYPNPYYAYNPAETNRFNRFVTFTHLPANATIRIFNLAGQIVKVIKKDGAFNPGQFERWDLNNQYGFPVASGIYIAHIDMPDIGKTKILKLVIIQEQEVLETY